MVIYKATNKINGKQYIGKTIYEMEHRQKKHVSDLYSKDKKHFPLYLAIKKHGKNNFEWEVVDQAETEEELNKKEILWIALLNTLSPNGYNLTIGGDGKSGYKHTEESKRKISANNYWNGREGVNKGKKFSDEHRRKLSESHKGHPCYITYDERLIELLRSQKLGEKNPMYGKPCVSRRKVINLDTLEIYDSLHEVREKAGISWQNVGNVCRGVRPKAGGFRWSYYDEYMTIPCQADDESEGVTTIRKE